MDKQKKLVLILFILVIMVLGLAIYFGINSNSTGKTVVINNANQEPEVVVDPGFVITKQNESLIVKNDDYNYELTLPKDWQQYEDSNSGQIIFYSGDVEIQGVGTELSKGMKLDILIEPADQGLTLVENIESFFSQIENYEEIEVNGLPAIVVENNDLGYSKATYIFDNIEGLIFILAGYDGGVDGGGDFAIQYDEIVNSFKLTNR